MPVTMPTPLNEFYRVVAHQRLTVGGALEDIPRHAARGAVAAHGVAVGSPNDKQRLLHSPEVEIALRNSLATSPRVLGKHVEGKVLGNIAPQARNQSEGVVFVGADARAALDIAVRVDKVDLRAVVAGIAIGEQLVAAHERRAAADAQKIPEREAARAVRAATRGQQRIVTVRAERAVERGRLGNLRRGVVVHVAEVHIDLDIVRQFVVAAGVEIPALHGALVVIARAEVVGLSRAAGQGYQGAVQLLEQSALTVTGVEAAEVGRADTVDRRRAAQRTRSRIAIASEEFALSLIAGKQGDIAAAIAGVKPHKGRDQVVLTAGVTARILDTGTPENVRHKVVVVGILTRAGLEVDLETFEIALGDEVHDSGHRIRAVHGRGAGGNHIDALDKRRRDDIDVDRRVEGTAEGQSLTVQKHQRSLGVETAKVQAGGSPGTVGNLGGLVCEDVGQQVDDFFDAGDAAAGDLFGADLDQRHRRRDVRFGQAGARDDHLFNNRLVSLSERGRCAQRGQRAHSGAHR